MPPAEFARAVVPRGVTTVVTDPHEIANVLGLEGIRFMLRDAEGAPLDVRVIAPSCVPATAWRPAARAWRRRTSRRCSREPWLLGLAEVMNFPGVVDGDPDVLAKLRAFDGRASTATAPASPASRCTAYAAAGISTDHECVTVEEAREKLRAGLVVFLREATNARNLRDPPPPGHAGQRAAPLLLHRRPPPGRPAGRGLDRPPGPPGDRRGDRPGDRDPHGDAQHRPSTSACKDRGAVAPGRRADLFVFTDLRAPRAELVFRGGELVAQDGRMVAERTARRGNGPPPRTVHLDVARLDFAIPAGGQQVRVIGVIPDQLVTEHLVLEPAVRDGQAVADPARDLLKMAVVERHRGTGNIGPRLRARGRAARRGRSRARWPTTTTTWW